MTRRVRFVVESDGSATEEDNSTPETATRTHQSHEERRRSKKKRWTKARRDTALPAALQFGRSTEEGKSEKSVEEQHRVNFASPVSNRTESKWNESRRDAAFATSVGYSANGSMNSPLGLQEDYENGREKSLQLVLGEASPTDVTGRLFLSALNEMNGYVLLIFDVGDGFSTYWVSFKPESNCTRVF